MNNWTKSFIVSLVAALLAAVVGATAFAAPERPDLSIKVGDRVPVFSVATSQDYLADYDRDYYGKHHLILTFFPAAFTPV